MRKLLIFCAACLIGISAMAQEIDAVKFVQNGTTDWYMLSAKPKVTFDANFNPVIVGKTYDIAQGVVKTTFGTAPIVPTILPMVNGQLNEDPEQKTLKIIRDGQFIIIREGKTYNIWGVEK